MRGKEKGRRTHKVKSGITPAYAGKSAYLSPEDTAGRDHPRVCGEKYSWEKSTCKIFGSPPRMRGKAGLVQIVCRLRGITPAYAGKSHKVRLQAPGRWDHPRVCGEKALTGLASGNNMGSPPRMRGKVAYTDLQRPSPGITPAYAGKSLLKLLHHVGLRDHPRVCGEKAYSLVINGSEWGSPPRMRGKGTKRCSSRRGGRITPAYAGKSKRIAPSSVLFGDHPRVCGEKSRTCSIVLDVGGSPPRMRGKGGHRQTTQRRYRITPAYAGKRSVVLSRP